MVYFHLPAGAGFFAQFELFFLNGCSWVICIGFQDEEVEVIPHD